MKITCDLCSYEYDIPHKNSYQCCPQCGCEHMPEFKSKASKPRYCKCGTKLRSSNYGAMCELCWEKQHAFLGL